MARHKYRTVTFGEKKETGGWEPWMTSVYETAVSHGGPTTVRSFVRSFFPWPKRVSRLLHASENCGHRMNLFIRGVIAASRDSLAPLSVPRREKKIAPGTIRSQSNEFNSKVAR